MTELNKISVEYSLLELFGNTIGDIEIGVDADKGNWYIDLKGLLRYLPKTTDPIIKHLNEKNIGLDSRNRYWYSAFIPPISRENGEVFKKFLKVQFKTAIKNKIRNKIDLENEYKPHATTIALTAKCNYKCEHCSFKSKKQATEWNLYDLKNVIDQLLKLSTYNITYTGGEPLLYSDLEEAIGYVDKKEAIVGMFSNGALLTKKRAQGLKDYGLDYIFISIDSPYKREHNKNRLGREDADAFDRAIEAVKIAKKTGLVTGISIFMTPEKVERGYAEEMYQLGKKLEVDEIVYFDGVPAGKFAMLPRTQLLSHEQHRELAEFHMKKNKKGVEGPRATTMSYINFNEWSGGRCFAFNNQAYIDPEGNMFGCDFQDFSTGNVREIGVKEAFERGAKHPLYNTPCGRCRKQSYEFNPIRIATDRIKTQKPDSVVYLDDIEKFFAQNYGTKIPITWDELEKLREKGLTLDS